MILVTGGAGFIGANFVLDWLAAGDEPVVNLDKLTYAGNLENLRSLAGRCRAMCSCRATSATARWSTRCCAEHRPRARDQLRGRKPRRPLDPRPRRLHRDQRGRHLQAAGGGARATGRSCPRTSRRAFRFLHVSTDEVYGSLGPTDPAFSETTPYAPNSPYSASQGRLRPPGARLPPHLRPAGADHQLLEQLRPAASFPRS